VPFITPIVPSILLFLALLLYFCRKNKAEKTDDQQTQKKNKQKNKKQNKKQKKKKNTTKVAPAASKIDRVEEQKGQEERQRASATIAILVIQAWWYKTRGNKDGQMRAKHLLVNTAQQFQRLLLNATPSAGSVAIDMVTEVIVGEAQGEVDGRIEEVTAEATGDTAGGEIEVDSFGKTEEMTAADFDLRPAFKKLHFTIRGDYLQKFMNVINKGRWLSFINIRRFKCFVQRCDFNKLIALCVLGYI
jgi:hypothetical protein